MGIQPEGERKNDMGRPVFRGADTIFLFFQGLFLYTEMLYKSHEGTAVLTFIKVMCFIQMYSEVLGVLHHYLLTIYDPLLVTAVSQHLFLQGWLFLKQTPPK